MLVTMDQFRRHAGAQLVSRDAAARMVACDMGNRGAGTYVGSDGGSAIAARSARDAARIVTGECRFEVWRGVSHWILDECPDRVADLLLEWLAAHPA